MPDTHTHAPRGPGAGADAADMARRLAQRLESIRAQFPACDVGAVAEVVRAILATMSGHLTATEVLLLAEVRELGHTVARARAEIAAIQVDDITVSHIPLASDELDAVLTHTAAATNVILEECEALDALAATLESGAPAETVRQAAADGLRRATMRIYEACGFQDLTGQRISKVVAALQAIDRRIARILAATEGLREPGSATESASLAPAALVEASADQLLHGPQLPEAAMNQDDIDQLLADL